MHTIFPIESVQKCIFTLANRLYGLTFRELEKVLKYHSDVKVYEVLDENKENLAIFMSDYFTRPTVEQSAWMDEMKKLCIDFNRKKHHPIIYKVANFEKPTLVDWGWSFERLFTEKLRLSPLHITGFIKVELVSAAYLDLMYSLQTKGEIDKIDILKFEMKIAEVLKMPKEIEFRYHRIYFKHIFGIDMYAYGYYIQF